MGKRMLMVAGWGKRMAVLGPVALLLFVALTAVAWGQPGDEVYAGMPPMMGGDTNIETAGIYVQDGVYLPEKSTPGVISGGTVNSAVASGVMITSDMEALNGVYVKGGNSEYTLSDATIKLSGNGSNDFGGVGSATMADGGGTLILKNVEITTDGCIRPATTAKDHGTLKAYDATFVVNGGTPPEDYEPFIGPGMMEVPAPLKITGTARACLVTDNAESYFYNCTIIADGWGALSTDMGNGHVYLEANNCTVRVLKSGYGTYADGNGCRVVINDSSMDIATYMAVVAGDGEVVFNNVIGTSGANCMMMHTVATDISEVGVFVLKGGSITTDDAAILMKSTNTDVTIDGTALVSKSGVLIRSIINDDAKAPKVNGRQVAGYRATLKNATLVGDILHEDPDRGMSIALQGTTLKGTIQNAALSVDAGSRWTATADSNVTFIGSVDAFRIDAPEGVTITAVSGEGCGLKGATYHLGGGGMLKVIGI